MNVVKATRQFEAWLGKRTPLVKKDLRTKHEAMKSSAFRFLRATYRWAQIWSKVCLDLAKSPRVLAVGDLHVENFGTWRDIEGRLIWGVNDFDEAYPLPYANDLLRLAVSAHLASEAGQHALRVGIFVPPSWTVTPKECVQKASRMFSGNAHMATANRRK